MSEILKIKGNFIPAMFQALGYSLSSTLLSCLYLNFRDQVVCNCIKQLFEQFMILQRNRSEVPQKENGESTTMGEKLEYWYSFWMDSLVALMTSEFETLSEYHK